jgi:hypothetical protein
MFCMRLFLFFGLMTGLGFGGPATAAEQRFASGPARVTLVELYTSEGCSSCPPAERWLGDLRGAPGLWRDFVPVAWHVDYWNRLGWPDRFSTKEFTSRQYAVASAWGSGSVYTPCFVRDGAEWRSGKIVPGRSAGGKPAGELVVVLEGPGRGRVEFTPEIEAGDGLTAHVAVLGGGFASKVTAGENRGETLRQEFVLLAVAEGSLVPGAGGGVRRAEFVLPKTKITDGERRAVAVWVTRRGELAPLQATGGWLEP